MVQRTEHILNEVAERISKRMINESATDRFIDNLIFNKLPEQSKPYVNMPLNDIISQHPEALNGVAINDSREALEKYGHLKLKDFIRISIMQLFDIHNGKGPVKYMRGIFRIMLEEIDCLRNPDMNRINQLKDDVMYIMQAANSGDKEAAQIDGNLNGLDAGTLHNTFKEKRKAFFQKIRDGFKGKTYGGNGHRYQKIVISEHEDAVPLQPYVGWCIAFDSSTNYDNYIQGGRRFYVFLRDDYKQFGKQGVPGENCPFDDYGMSMVSVLVDMEGNPTIITTRWNHEHDGELNPPTTEQLEFVQRLMGVNLYRECPPYTREELHAMGITPFDEVQELLDSGTDPRDIFTQVETQHEGYYRVVLNGKFNFIDNQRKLLSDKWFKLAGDFNEGFARVKLDNGRYNFINTKGQLINKDGFEDAWSFSEGFAMVKLDNGRWSFINTKGQLINNEGFETAYDFSEGYANVQLDNGKWSWINTSGQVINKDGFRSAWDFNEGFARVELDNGRRSFINTDFQVINTRGFISAGHFYDGFALVQLDNRRWSWINTDGQVIIKDGFRNAANFSEGFALVQLDNGRWSFINTKGQLINNEGFETAYDFSEGYAEVQLDNGNWCYLRKDGVLCDSNKRPLDQNQVINEVVHKVIMEMLR